MSYIIVTHTPPSPEAQRRGNTILWIVGSISCFLMLFIITGCILSVRSSHRAQVNAVEDKLFEDGKYVEERLKWLHDSIAGFRARLIAGEQDILRDWKDVHERYAGAEGILRGYCRWQVRRKKEMKVVDWGEVGMGLRRNEFVMSLRSALEERRELLVELERVGMLESVFIGGEREKLHESERILGAEGWAEVGCENVV